ncbi:uncharacterized protein PITG_04687 [Phytophthora infestans T30-4]|uniref:Uncharacterized protein n=1 Tax=Phytophthora infestans (strain T30-4) TaxID=403677 RepID=D0N1T6_PHYIT|nr:uncharacterized protein PITG_04687 [Phytophthora infestans T30-4]EEY68265.1 hypothetical protein PITG_04687 [Phytophthora infestans T30-4]|eukprot:XP_002905424.1 hypothetical protein PITG_04687 [Phytophthora infestans T30-4]
MKNVQALTYKSGLKKAEYLIKKGTATDVPCKISPEAYFDALKLDPKLKNIVDSSAARQNNPGLKKFYTYSNFWTASQRRKIRSTSPESYIEALKLDPKLKLIAHSKVARKNNPTLEKFFTYATKTSSKIRLNSVVKKLERISPMD